MNDLQSLFSLGYIFSISPTSDLNVVFFYTILFLIVLICGLFLASHFHKLSKTIKPYMKISERILNHTIFISIVGFLFTFFYWQEIPYLSTPVLLYILILILVYLVISDIIFYKTNILSDIDKYKQELEYKKYLPRKKRK